MRFAAILLCLIPSFALSSEALDYARTITPVAEYTAEKYDRTKYLHWSDSDKDCQSTRTEALIRYSLIIPEFDDPQHCKIIFGHWISPYSGKETFDPSALDVDHVVPLKEAHESGAYAWARNRRKDFANDLSVQFPQLLPVLASENRSKADKDIAQWLPKTGVCAYVETWVMVKKRWALTFDPAELRKTVEILTGCK